MGLVMLISKRKVVECNKTEESYQHHDINQSLKEYDI